MRINPTKRNKDIEKIFFNQIKKVSKNASN